MPVTADSVAAGERWTALRAAPVVAAQLAVWGLQPADPLLALDGRDEMLLFLRQVHGGDEEQALAAYYRSGRDIAGVLLQVLRWRFGEPIAAEVLDFASGYGRVTRFLAGALPAGALWVSDVLAEAVAFQVDALGLGGSVSAVDPVELRLERYFDAIAVTSLFTHLPEGRFADWLAALWRRLRPGGLLLFSTHDVALHPLVERRGEGFVFERTSESGTLSLDDYGTTWIDEGFAREAIARACPGAAARRLSRALCHFQDLWIVARPPAPDLATLRLQAVPEVMVEECVATPGEVVMRGWALARLGSVERVELCADDGRCAVATLEPPRPDLVPALGVGEAGGDLHGWSARLALPVERRAHAVLTLRAVDGAGGHHVCHGGRLDTLLAMLRAGQVLGLSAELHRLHGEHAAYRERCAQDLDELRRRIAAMQASRFWKLRNAWFAVKRALRLSDEP
jgi:SAM-dependent methyltransferase